MVLLLAGWLTVGCSAGTSTHAVTPPPAVAITPPPGSTVVAGGCGATPVYRGGVPAWLVTAGGGSGSSSGAPTALPYVIAEPQIAGAYLFGFPLRAGHPENPTNKVLWAMRLPRNGSNLLVNASPLGAASPTVSITLPDDSSPGDIYPSIVDVPFAGCWRLGLSWMGHHAELDLDYG
jgi:hypothetical protein